MNFEHDLALCPGLIWICILVPVILAALGNFLARKGIKADKRDPHHAIAYATLGPVATIFGVLGAFIVATTWNEYMATKSNLNEESNALRDIYFNAQSFNPELSNKIQNLCRNYRRAVTENEWKIILKGKDDLVGDRLLTKLSDLYRTYEPTTDNERVYFKMSVQNLENLRKYREQRIQDSCTGLLPLLWILFLLGASILISVSLLMISSPSQTHGAMSILLSAMIGIMTFAIISLDFPFMGFAKLSTMPFDMIPMGEKQARG